MTLPSLYECPLWTSPAADASKHTTRSVGKIELLALAGAGIYQITISTLFEDAVAKKECTQLIEMLCSALDVRTLASH